MQLCVATPARILPQEERASESRLVHRQTRLPPKHVAIKRAIMGRCCVVAAVATDLRARFGCAPMEVRDVCGVNGRAAGSLVPFS